MNVNAILEQHKIRTNCESTVVQDVRILFEKGGTVAINNILEDLGGQRFTFPQHAVRARMIGQKMILDCYNHKPIDWQAAVRYVDDKQNNPMNSWMFIEPEQMASSLKPRNEVKQVSAEVNVAVAVKSDGKIARGGRRVLVEELYKKYVLEGTEPTSRAEMINLIVRETGMTPAGASTYFADAKKQFGDPKGLVKSKRG